MDKKELSEREETGKRINDLKRNFYREFSEHNIPLEIGVGAALMVFLETTFMVGLKKEDLMEAISQTYDLMEKDKNVNDARMWARLGGKKDG